MLITCPCPAQIDPQPRSGQPQPVISAPHPKHPEKKQGNRNEGCLHAGEVTGAVRGDVSRKEGALLKGSLTRSRFWQLPSETARAQTGGTMVCFVRGRGKWRCLGNVVIGIVCTRGKGTVT
eukprot:3934942-Rhodomonas_salina.4